MFQGTISSAPHRLVYGVYEEGRPVNSGILRQRLVKENIFLDEKLDANIPIEEF